MGKGGDKRMNTSLNRNIRVLLVEDDLATSKILGSLLRSFEYEVTTAPNGKEALRLIRKLGNKYFDFVLSDLAMPEMNGHDLLLKVKEATRAGLTFIMMSSKDDEDTIMKSLEAGATDFLVKPLKGNELKNLWMHVWRKEQGSKSQSPILTNDDANQSIGSPDEASNSGSEDKMMQDGNEDNEIKTATVQIKRARAPDLDSAHCPDDLSEQSVTITLELAVSPASTDLVLNRLNNGHKSAFRTFSRSVVMVDSTRINEIVGKESFKMPKTPTQRQHVQFGTPNDDDDTILHVLKATNNKRQEAVLKYLQKRKERTFEKKVRYESRKRVAELRPRIMGRFVKAQTAAVQETTPPTV